MGARRAENLDHQVRRAIYSLRNLEKVGSRIDITTQADNFGDAVEIAAECGAGLRLDIECRQPARRLRCRQVEFPAGLADVTQFRVPGRQLARYE